MNLTFYTKKGGTGKTTSCLAFGACLRERGHTVALFDIDPQRNLSGGTFIDARDVQKVVRKTKVEYSLFDCPPSLGDESTAALRIADIVIIPVQLEYYAAKGLAAILEILHDAQSRGYQFEYRILPTMLDRRIKISVEFEAGLRERFGVLVLPTISRSSAVVQASAREMSVVEYAPKSRAALDYKAAVDELMKGCDT